MKNKTRKVLRLLLLAGLILCLIMLGKRFLDSRKGGEAYGEAERLAALPRTQQETEPTQAAVTESSWAPESTAGDPEAEALAQINLEALREVNPDVVGWIRIPGTVVDYPLMQGEDNETYLRRTWDGESNSMGSIFLEYQCSAELTDFNTIVYGHNMSDRTMFAVLKNYEDPEYREEHPYVYILSDAGVYRYEVFSSYKAKVGSGTYALGIRKTETKRGYIDQILEASVIDAGVVPETTDRILTLSTCSHMGYDTRWVVHARLKMVEQNG